MYIDFSQCFAPSIPSQLCPLVLIVVLLGIIFCPFHLFYNTARQWFGITLGRIMLSGLLPVEFRDFFIADELNSMAFSLWMSIYFFCVYSWHWNDLDLHCNVPKMWVAPLIACFPPFWRFLQCLRRYYDSGEKVHLINAMKYSTSILSTVMAGVRRIHSGPTIEVVWILMSIINSSYTSIWDVKIDWGLLDLSSSNFLLRDDLVFYKWTYYVAIPLNIMLRFSWAINKAGLVYSSQTITFATAAFEAFRRFVWNFYRLENEHLNNCGNYRAIKEIPLPFSLQEAYRSSADQTLEEGSIRLSSDEDEVVLSPVSLMPNSMMPATPNTNLRTSVDLGRVPTLKKSATFASQGTFYGRRDFESRQDRDDFALYGVPSRQGSMVGQVLERIRTFAATDDHRDGESDSEADESD
ncbi:EXS-domain-containing protein [Hesseltinella vesiculosa]|uniref:EXS-domain-containing protein n=1 Tax=Hesseltinella vesiculosa TaxID=101127 RepID=A0A1X2GJ48_9FUNG|nr:EXS-domain-containing protein [Hesseltinella vesiculosa]